MPVSWSKLGGVQALHDAVCCSQLGHIVGLGQLMTLTSETMTMVILHSPVVQPDVAWLQGLWAGVVEVRVQHWMPGFCLPGTIWCPLCGTQAGGGGMLVWSRGPTCACSSAVLPGICALAGRSWPGAHSAAAAVVELMAS